MENFSKRLTARRESLHLTKTEVAKKLGVGLSTYANWEYGYNKPEMETLIKLAKILGTSVSYLSGEINNPAQPKITDSDLNKMLDSASSFEGLPMSDHDRNYIRSMIKLYYENKNS